MESSCSFARPRGAVRGGARLAPQGPRARPALGYIDFMALVRGAAAVITDSGGVQEETTLLRVPLPERCAPAPKRPVTVTSGSNQLVPPHDLKNRNWPRPC